MIGEAMVEFARTSTKGCWTRGFAGDVFNSAYYLAQIESTQNPVRFFSCIGQDSASESFLDFVNQSQIDPAFISQSSDRQMGLYTIELEGSERHFSYWRDSSAARHMLQDHDALDLALAKCDQVYLSGITLAILCSNDRAHMLTRLWESPQKVMFDPNIRPKLWECNSVARAALTSAGQIADWIFPTFDDEAALFGDRDPEETAQRYLHNGASEVIVKCGKEACLVATRDSIQCVAARDVTPIDTTAAGDSFNAGYIAGRNAGLAPADAAERAHHIAAHVIQSYGALVELPSDLRTT